MVEEDLAAALGSRTLAVIHVHPFGIPQPIDRVLEWSRAVQAVVIEDAAQAMGSRLAGRRAGAWGDYGLYSLGPGKPLSLGGGGILSLNGAVDPAEIETAWQALPPSSRLASASAWLRLTAYWLAFQPRGWWLATRLGSQRIAEREAASAYTMSRLSAAQARVGLATLPRLDHINIGRRTRGHELTTALSGLDYAHVPVVDPSTEPIYLRWPALIEDTKRREWIYRRLRSGGIGVGKMYRQSLPDLFGELREVHCPGARFVAAHLLTLPTHHHVADREVETMVDVVQSARSPWGCE
jgi:dTDP-4-amino-4,6-dideoxygalactose transaminase